MPRSFVSVSALAAALVLLVGTGCAEKTKASSGGGRRGPGGVPPVVVGTVERKFVPLTLEAVGSVEPILAASVRSQITGTALKIHFREGQDVQAGDVLFELDSRPFRQAVQTAEAEVQRFTAQLENARAQLARYRALSADSFVSQELLQNSQATARTLAAQLAAAESALAGARLQVDYCTLRAPLSGRTGSLGARMGDLVRASDASTALVVINQLDPIYVAFGVPSQHLATLARYRAAGPITVTATPHGHPDKAVTGELTFIDNAVDPATGTVKLKATFPNADHRLWPGQFANLRVNLAAPEGLVVPVAALQNTQKGSQVFVVTAEKNAELRPVVVERTHGLEAVIARGLAAGESVIVDGQLRVQPGRPVEVKLATAAPAAGATSERKKRKAE